MSLSGTDFLGSAPERLLAGAIVLHEASSHADLLPELPVLLRATLSAASVAIVFVGMDGRGMEIARVAHFSGAAGESQSSEDWVAALLRERLARRAAGDMARSALRDAGGNRLQIFCEMDGERGVAFDISAPAAFDARSPQGRAWLLAILENMARNMNLRLSRPIAATLSMPKLNELTPGEWRILLAMDSNNPEKAIAASLGLSTHTIHSHIKNIYRVLDVRSRLEAIALLRRFERAAMLQSLLKSAGDSRAESWLPVEYDPENPPDGWTPILRRQEALAVPGSRRSFQPVLTVKTEK